MIGLPDNSRSQELIRSFFESKRIVSAVCHAPCVFTEVKLSNGTNLLKGRKLTSFSNEEEEQAQMVSHCPYLVETRIEERGGFFQKSPPWEDNVVVDKDADGRVLITGANPQSGASLAREIIKELSA